MMIDVKPFCSTDSTRYPAIRHPFVRDGVRYGTDGRVIIAVACPGEPDSQEGEGRVPRASDVLPALPRGLQWDAWPEVSACKNCKDTPGFQLVPCKTCKGTGQRWCKRCQDTHDCQCCEDGSEVQDCPCRICRVKIGNVG